MPSPQETEERLALARAALEGPLQRVVGYAVSPGVTAEDLADVVSAMALRISNTIWTEIDSLP